MLQYASHKCLGLKSPNSDLILVDVDSDSE